MQEDNIFNDLGDSANFKKASIVKKLALHTNGSENDIRAHVTRRKVSAGTRSDLGRDCRDAFLGLAKTCTKLGVSFWDYLGSRLAILGQCLVPPRPDLIRCRGQPT